MLTGANGMCFAVAVNKDPREADVILFERTDDQDGGLCCGARLHSEVIFHRLISKRFSSFKEIFSIALTIRAWTARSGSIAPTGSLLLCILDGLSQKT